MKKTLFLSFVFLVFVTNINAQVKDSLALVTIKAENIDTQNFKITENLSYQYSKPKFFDFVTKIPNDFGIMGNMFIQKDNLIWFGASVGATAAIIPFDQRITNTARDYADQLGVSENHTYSGPIKAFPKTVNSGIYRIGNGFTAILVGGGLLTYGLINKNYRAVHTSSEIVEGLIASGLLVQPFKRITGRESPFPSFAAFGKNTPSYDAMPSGHLTTLMTTVMIISENYKEVKWIKPVGYSVMGLMGVEMLQSKVHWASDYPIAVFMGYVIGKSIVKGRIVEKKTTTVGEMKTNFKPKFSYSFSSNQYYTLAGMNVRF
jgi:hypothetical protein